MASGFDILLRINKLDVRIAEIKVRAANLDAGRSVQQAMDALKPEWETLTQRAHQLKADLKDANLLQQSLEDKIQSIEKMLYSGKVVNSKEIEAYQKEQAMFRRQKDEAEMVALGVMEILPGAEEASAEINHRMSQLQGRRKKLYDAAVAAKEELEKAYKEAATARNELAKKVDAPLLKEYEAMRAHGNGIAIAEITDTGNCGMCGTTVPRKSIELAKEDKRVTCGNCHRWLFVPILKVDS